MGISENFLVNTKSFDPIIKALISQSEHPDTISDTTLEKMGYDNPSDLLVLHVLRGLDIINQDKTPSDLYFKMVDPDHTKEAIAEGVINGYGDLFLENYNIHKMLPGEIQDELKDYFDGKKTDLIIKYIANTFHKLVSYAGVENVEVTRNRMLGDEMQSVEAETENKADMEAEQSVEEPKDSDSTVKEAGNNGKTKPDYKAASEQKEISSRSVEEILFGENRADDDGNESMEEGDEQEPDEVTGDLSEPEAEAETEYDEMEDEDSGLEDESEEGKEIEMDTPPTSEEQQPEEVAAGQTEPPALAENGELSLSQLNTSDERIQKAVVKRSELQYKLGRNEDALESCEEIIAYFDRADEPFLSRAVSDAVIRRVELVRKLEQDHKLLPALNEVIRRFSNSDKPEYYEQASRSMLQKAELLEAQDFDRKDLLPLYNNIINRLEQDSDPHIQEKVNEIFIRRLELLNQTDDKSELLKALEQSIDRFSDSSRFRKYLEETLFRKAEILEDMNRNEEALEAYTTFLEEFGQPVDS